MPSLTMQIAAFGFLTGVLLLHVGLAYGLHHRRPESGALPFMGFLGATLGTGLAFCIHILLIQVTAEEQGGRQVYLITSLLNLPFFALAPFFLLLFACGMVGKALSWKFKWGYWLVFGLLTLLDLGQHLRLLLLPNPSGIFRIYPYSFASAELAILGILLYLGAGVLRTTDRRRRIWGGGVVLALAFTRALLIMFGLFGVTRVHIEVSKPVPAQVWKEPLAIATPLASGTAWNPLIMALGILWGPIPAFWVLRKWASLPQPEAEIPTTGAAPPASPGEVMERCGLTPREAEVASLVVEGRTNKEICDMLFLSLDTVKRHITNVYKKTATKNRVQLTRLLHP